MEGMIEMIGDYEQVCTDLRQKDQGSMVTQGKQLIETIEALRRFVRAHDAVENGTISFDLQHKQVQELSDSREALPDWITDV
jgi:hypothetical protein